MIRCSDYFTYFNRYSKKFLEEIDPKCAVQVRLKIVHTYNVLRVMRKIARLEGLEGEDFEIAKVIGLFHDFGRFKQSKLYGCFDDTISINHAKASVDELIRLNVLDEVASCIVKDDIKDLIYRAIINHNKDRIPEEEKDERIILYSKLIRDADKLDIYRSVADFFAKEPLENYLRAKGSLINSFEVSKEVEEKIKKGIMLKRADIKTIADEQIWAFYWSISDLNFKSSQIILKESGYMKKLHDAYIEGDKMTEGGSVDRLYNYVMKKFEEDTK